MPTILAEEGGWRASEAQTNKRRTSHPDRQGSYDKRQIVLVERRTKHELYGKIVGKSSKYHAHDERRGEYAGDVVEIAESRPISRPAVVVTRSAAKAAAVSQPPRTRPLRASGEAAGTLGTYWRPAVFHFRGRNSKEQEHDQVGDKLPAGKLAEFIEVEGSGCLIGPTAFDVAALTGQDDRDLRPARRLYARPAR